jgi:hypothetical protein
MTIAWLGRPIRGAVCLVAARRRGITACLQCSRAVTAPGTALVPSYVGLVGPVPGRMLWG